MMYALIRPDSSIDRRASDIDPTVKTRAGWKWLPVAVAGDDAFDPASQIKTGPVTTVETARVLDTFTIRSKTAGELDADKVAKVDGIDIQGALLKVILNLHNRIRTLEGQPTHTMAQLKAALKALI